MGGQGARINHGGLVAETPYFYMFLRRAHVRTKLRPTTLLRHFNMVHSRVDGVFRPYMKNMSRKKKLQKMIRFFTKISKSYQNHIKFIPKSFENHPKIIPKSDQHCPKITPKSNQNHTKIVPRPGPGPGPGRVPAGPGPGRLGVR